MSTPATSGMMTDEEVAEQIVRQAYEREDSRTRRPLAAWVRPTMRILPRLLAITTIANGAIGLLAVVAPFLRMRFGEAATRPIYGAYSYICPQRDDHTWFINGVPMPMEQRMVAMYLAFGVAGLLFVTWSRMRRPLQTWIAALLIAPVVIDVAISTAGILPSTGVSRLWTGALSAYAIVWWSYPRFAERLTAASAHVAAITGVRGRSPRSG
ncbi:MAG TPA: DUF2085 domain-containing protein [Thermomicrobiales bacterium]|nr:DUF2085 domain-containing protein [Thermomicrobiales bacterium]